jgi:RNA polymerase sigma-70 factor (ECF subfamily)
MSAHETIREMAISSADLGDEAASKERVKPMDEAEFRAFYDRTARVLALYLRRITGDSHLADDLLQEAYYRFVRAGATYDDETHRKNSLFRIATNLALDARRAQRRWPRVPLDAPGAEDAMTDADRGPARAEGRVDLQKAFGQLRANERQILWLAYGLGSSHAEIAQTVGMKAASVKLLLFRARRKLAAILTGAKGGSRGAK